MGQILFQSSCLIDKINFSCLFFGSFWIFCAKISVQSPEINSKQFFGLISFKEGTVSRFWDIFERFPAKYSLKSTRNRFQASLWTYFDSVEGQTVASSNPPSASRPIFEHIKSISYWSEISRVFFFQMCTFFPHYNVFSALGFFYDGKISFFLLAAFSQSQVEWGGGGAHESWRKTPFGGWFCAFFFVSSYSILFCNKNYVLMK